MAGKWDRTRVEAGNVYAAVNQIDIQLPVSNFIGSVWVRMAGLGGATPVTVNLMGIRVRAQIIADGSKVIYNQTLRCGQQAVQYQYGVTPELATAGAAGATTLTLPILFGRFLGDELYILPAKIYKTLVLRLQFGVVLNANTDLFNAAGAALEVDVDQYISEDEKYSKKVIKLVEIEQHVNAAAAAVNRYNIPLQGSIARYSIHGYTTATGAAAAIPTITNFFINNGERLPFSGVIADYDNFNLCPFTYVPNGVHVVEFDQGNTGARAIDLRPLGQFQVEVTEAAVAGTVVQNVQYILNPSEI